MSMTFKRSRFVAIIPVLIAAAAGLPSHGMPSSRLAQDRHPDWTGFYRTARGKDLAGFQPLNRNLPDIVTAHLEPWARLKMEETNGVADDVGAVCQNDGIFRETGALFLLSAPDKIIMVWGPAIDVGGVQRVYLNRQHPRNLSFTWNGDSIGHWEGDTLVVDMVGFNDKSWLTSSMHPHTEEMHVVERIRSVAEGLLEVETTVDDRKALLSPYAFTRYYKYSAPEMRESICNGDPGEQEMWVEFRRRQLKKRFIPPDQTKNTQ